MLLRLSTIVAVLACLCFADTLTLRSGRVITGQYLGGDARHIRMAVGDHVDTFNVEDIGDIEFSGDSRSAVPSAPPPPQPPPPPANQSQSNQNQPNPNQ